MTRYESSCIKSASKYMKKDKTLTNVISDEKLVLQAQAGDRQSFEELVKRYEKKVYNVAFRITSNKDDASDILQDTFFQVLKKITTFKGESRFSTWLFRITANIALMKKRKDKKSFSYSLDTPVLTDKGDEIRRQIKDDWTENPLDNLENKELNERIKKAIEMLHPDYKVPLILRDINGLSNEDVSKILNISLAAVKSRVHRARIYLRENLSEYFKDMEVVKNGF